MSDEPKKCPKCGSFHIIRKGQRNSSTYWYCNDCKRYSRGCKKPSQEAIFNRYSQAHLPLNSSLRSSVSPLLPLSVNSRITPRTRWNIHPEKWWYKWIPPIGEGTLVSSFLWMLKVFSSSIILHLWEREESRL